MNEKHRSGKLPKSKGAPGIIEARIKSQQALELRLAGQTYLQIANAIGYRSVSSAERAVHRLHTEGFSGWLIEKPIQLDVKEPSVEERAKMMVELIHYKRL